MSERVAPLAGESVLSTWSLCSAVAVAGLGLHPELEREEGVPGSGSWTARVRWASCPQACRLRQFPPAAHRVSCVSPDCGAGFVFWWAASRCRKDGLWPPVVPAPV